MQRGVAFAHEAGRNWAETIFGERGDSQGIERTTGSNLGFSDSWTDRVVDSSKLKYDDGSTYVITEDLQPEVRDSRFPLLSRVKYRLHSALAAIAPDD